MGLNEAVKWSDARRWASNIDKQVHIGAVQLSSATEAFLENTSQMSGRFVPLMHQDLEVDRWQISKLISKKMCQCRALHMDIQRQEPVAFFVVIFC